MAQRPTAPVRTPSRPKSRRASTPSCSRRCGRRCSVSCARGRTIVRRRGADADVRAMRLDVENCVRELVEFGLAHSVPAPARPLSRSQQPEHDAVARPARRVPRAARHGQPRGPLAGRPALPRDDRPRREDADRLRVDPHRRQVGHLGADPRSDRSGKEVVARMIHELSRRGAERSSRRSTAPRCPTRCSSRRFSATRRGRSPARTTASRAGWSWRTTARCSSTKSATCRSSPRPSCCACSRSADSNGSGATSRSRSISG